MTLVLLAKKKAKEHPLRVLLDPGSQIPVLSRSLVEHLALPQFKHDVPILIKGYNGDEDRTAGLMYTGPLVLRHGENHFSRLEFEISDLDDQCDAILPHWWLCEHKPEGFYDGNSQKISFPSASCRQNCTSLKLLGKLGRVASLAEDRATIPERFQKLAPLAAPDVSQRLPAHKPWDHSIDLVEGKTPPWGP
ncbi:hypothetical protein QBC35DRAFT_396735, partial [Podospora australis]